MVENLDKILHKVTRPGRYTGGEWNSVVKNWESTEVRVALSYPDAYEVGMSNLGLGIIYDLLNRHPAVLAERVFSPWVDMEVQMRSHGVPLFTLESKRPVRDFDVIAFSLGYELTYTNVLNMLDLAGVPLLAADRDDSHPLVMAGGSCTLNPEPVAGFIDLFVVGEGEEVTGELIEVVRKWKTEGSRNKHELLRAAARIPGVYVPSFYNVDYNQDGTVASIKPCVADTNPVVERRIVHHLPPPLTRPVVPFIEVIHDRGAVEIQRGCPSGCRFCQAGMVYRPLRERSHEEVVSAVEDLVKSTGYDEVALLSLSSSDYNGIDRLVSTLCQKYEDSGLTFTLPSLRADSFSVKLADSLRGKKKIGLTFAPEAGTERMRRVINKGVSEQEVLLATGTARERGWHNVKLYFMVGLPTETDEDIQGIIDVVRRIRYADKRRMDIRVTASTFVPKAHTPFQWAAQAPEEALLAKHEVLKAGLRKMGVHLSWNDPRVSLLEAVMSRGDRRLGAVIHRAWQLGCKFDAWNEHFSFDKWRQAFDETGWAPEFYACRERAGDEVMPWSHIDAGVASSFLWREYQRSKMEKETPTCRSGPCATCGLQGSVDSCRSKYQELVGQTP